MEKAAIRELFEDPEFVQHFQNAILIPAIVAANSERDEKITELEEELSETKEQLTRTNEELTSIKRQLEAMEAYSRRNCLTISGIPEREGESTDQLVVAVAKAAGVTITTSDLDRSHRVGQPKRGRPRNIIVKLLSYNLRQRLYEARRDLSARRVQHPIMTREVLEAVYISDLLTQKAQHLLFVGRQLKKKGKLSAAYSTNGTVKVRVSDNQPAKIIAEIADYSELLGAGDSQLQEVLSASGHPTRREGAAVGTSGTPGPAGGSKATAAGAWVRVGHKSGNGKAPDTVANRPQTRSSSQ